MHEGWPRLGVDSGARCSTAQSMWRASVPTEGRGRSAEAGSPSSGTPARPSRTWSEGAWQRRHLRHDEDAGAQPQAHRSD